MRMDLMNGIDVFIRWDMREVISCPPLYEKTAVSKPGRRRLSQNTLSAGTLNLDFLAPRTVRIKCCLRYPVYGI